MTDRTIVGIDPGTTAAVAVISLDGELEGCMSGKNRGKNDLIRFIVDHGNPLIVASDVSPAPALVAEIASNLGAVLYAPEEDLQSDYKQGLVGGFGLDDADAHSRDALAAAEYARREHAEKLDGVRRRVHDAGQADDTGAVLDLVFRDGYAVSDALQQVAEPEQDEPDRKTKQRAERDWERIAGKRMRTIDRLRAKVEHLEEYVATLEDDEPENVQQGVPEEELLERNRLIADLRDEMRRQTATVERLQDENKRLNTAVQRLEDGWIRVPTVNDPADATTSIVHLPTYGGEPVSDTVDTIIADTVTGKRGGVTVIERRDVPHVELADGLVVDPDALKHGDTEEFMAWLEEYRDR